MELARIQGLLYIKGWTFVVHIYQKQMTSMY